jgi:hypothetical protein
MEVETAAFHGPEPTLGSSAFVGAVVVENEVDIEFRGVKSGDKSRDRLRNPEIPERSPRKKAMKARQRNLGVE